MWTCPGPKLPYSLIPRVPKDPTFLKMNSTERPPRIPRVPKDPTFLKMNSTVRPLGWKLSGHTPTRYLCQYPPPPPGF